MHDSLTKKASSASGNNKQQFEKFNKFCDKPRCLLATIAASIFVAEALVMLVISVLQPVSTYIQAILDGFLLIIIVFPALYFFTFKPLQIHIAARKKAAEEQEKLIAELHQALAEIKTLSGLLPICASCKKIRDDKGYWNQIETYISTHSEAEFSHGICPECMKKLYPQFASAVDKQAKKKL